MSYLLVKTTNNWADEIDTEGFAIFTSKAYLEHMVIAQEAFESGNQISKYIGTNEEIEFEDLKDYVEQITVQEITMSEMMALCKTFEIKLITGPDVSINSNSYGLNTLIDNDELEDIENDGDGNFYDDDDNVPF